MSSTEIVRSWLQAVERRDAPEARRLMAPGFACDGLAPIPLDRDELLSMYVALASAFPDWRFHPRDYAESEDEVRVVVTPTGTHKRELDIRVPRVRRIPPTNRAIRLQDQSLTFTVRGGRLVGLRFEGQGAGGLDDLLPQLAAVAAGASVPR